METSSQVQLGVRRQVFGFLDETGLLHSPATDRFFGLGLLIAQRPSEIHRHIIDLRNRTHFYSEFKFSEVSQQNLNLYTALIDLFFKCKDLRFHCAMYDKSNLDVPAQFKRGYDSAYNTFVARLIANSLNPSEYVAILADDVSTKKDNNFEKQIREKIKQKTRRNALFGISRLESHAVAEIQLVDVLIGTIAYAHKVKNPNHGSAKAKLVKHLQKCLTLKSLSGELNLKLRNGLTFCIEEH